MSPWGDFRRDDRGLRAPSEGPSGWTAGVGLLLFFVGLVAVVVAQTTYSEWNVEDARTTQHPTFLLVPGVALLIGGIVLFVWGWWRQHHVEG